MNPSSPLFQFAANLSRQEGKRLLSAAPPPVALVIHDFGVAQFGNAAIARLYASLTGGEFVELRDGAIVAPVSREAL